MTLTSSAQRILERAEKSEESLANDTGNVAIISALLEQNQRMAEDLQNILNQGNVATIGKWDATDEMKASAYNALLANEATMKELGEE